MIKTGLSTDFLCHLFHRFRGNFTLTVLYIFKLKKNIFESYCSSQTYIKGKGTINCIKLSKKNINLIHKQDLEFTIQLSKLRFKCY